MQTKTTHIYYAALIIVSLLTGSLQTPLLLFFITLLGVYAGYKTYYNRLKGEVRCSSKGILGITAFIILGCLLAFSASMQSHKMHFSRFQETHVHEFQISFKNRLEATLENIRDSLETAIRNKQFLHGIEQANIEGVFSLISELHKDLDKTIKGCRIELEKKGQLLAWRDSLPISVDPFREDDAKQISTAPALFIRDELLSTTLWFQYSLPNDYRVRLVLPLFNREIDSITVKIPTLSSRILSELSIIGVAYATEQTGASNPEEYQIPTKMSENILNIRLLDSAKCNPIWVKLDFSEWTGSSLNVPLRLAAYSMLLLACITLLCLLSFEKPLRSNSEITFSVLQSSLIKASLLVAIAAFFPASLIGEFVHSYVFPTRPFISRSGAQLLIMVKDLAFALSLIHSYVLIVKCSHQQWAGTGLVIRMVNAVLLGGILTVLFPADMLSNLVTSSPITSLSVETFVPYELTVRDLLAESIHCIRFLNILLLVMLLYNALSLMGSVSRILIAMGIIGPFVVVFVFYFETGSPGVPALVQTLLLLALALALNTSYHLFRTIPLAQNLSPLVTCVRIFFSIIIAFYACFFVPHHHSIAFETMKQRSAAQLRKELRSIPQPTPEFLKFMNTLKQQIANQRDFPKVLSAMQIWSQAPFKSLSINQGVSIIDMDGKIRSSFGEINNYLTSPTPSESDTLLSPLLQSVNLGQRNLQVISWGLKVSNGLNESFLILFHTLYSLFPRTEDYHPWYFPLPQWLVGNEIKSGLNHFIHNEYRDGIIRSSSPELSIPLPSDTRAQVTLNQRGWLWQRKTIKSQLFDVFYIIPAMGGTAPDLVSLAFPRPSLRTVASVIYATCSGFLLIGVLCYSVVLILSWLSSLIARKLPIIDDLHSPFPSYHQKVQTTLFMSSLIPLLIISLILGNAVATQSINKIREHNVNKLRRVFTKATAPLHTLANNVGRLYLASLSESSVTFSLSTLFIDENVRYINISDTQGYSLFEKWLSLEKREQLLEDDDARRAIAFSRNAPEYSFDYFDGQLFLTGVVPVYKAGKNDFPALLVTVKWALNRAYLLKIAQLNGVNLAVYAGKQRIFTQDADILDNLQRSPYPPPSVFLQCYINARGMYSSFSMGMLWHTFLTAIPLMDTFGHPVAVLVAREALSRAYIHRKKTYVVSVLLDYFPPLLGLIILLSMFLTRRLNRPLKLLLNGISRLQNRDFSHTLPPVQDQEFSSLIKAFNIMSSQIREDRHLLEEQKRRIELILETVSTGIIVFDHSDTVIAVNQACANILAKRRNVHIVGMTLKSLSSDHELSDFFKWLLLMKGETKEGMDTITLQINGKTRTIAATIRKLPQNGDIQNLWLFAFDDITNAIEAKNREAMIHMARQVAHEVKNPLTPIQLSAEHIMQTYGDQNHTFPDILKKCIDTILEQVSNLRRITGEFSEFARLPTPKPSFMDLNDIVKSTLTPYIESARHKSAVQIIVELDENLPPAMVDGGLIKQVILNLFRNAEQAMGGTGKLIIRTGQQCIEIPKELRNSEKRVIEQSNHLWLSIRDHGPGMDRETMLKIFEPYFSTKKTGSGLGLVISKRIIEEMNGKIEVLSKPPQGTLFVIWLPM